MAVELDRFSRLLFVWGFCAIPKPRARGVASGLIIRSRWPRRYAPFSSNEKEMVENKRCYAARRRKAETAARDGL